MKDTVKTTCPYCGVGCGVDVTPLPEGGYKVRGSSEHPANFGKLCSKGSALAETLDLEGRLLEPQVAGESATWVAAFATMAERFGEIVREHGPDAVAFYVSGQLLTEDYYVANKLMKGFIGSANIDTNSRLCMSSSVAGHKRAFGSDTVPGNYEDLELADLLVLTGSNTAWCHPVLFQRIVRARKARADTERPLKVIVIDPRETATCDIADLHLPIQPGTDALLFNGLLHYLASQGKIDAAWVRDHTEGMQAALASASWSSPSIEVVAARCGLSAEAVLQFYQWFAEHERSVTVYSQGVNQSSSGTDKVNSILNCHLLTGRIGRPGMGPLSLTGQPNAMGGREVGGLANQLAAHMDFDNPAHCQLVADFWQAPNLATQPGYKAVELFEKIRSGQIKAVWVMATNPAFSLPDNAQVRAALAACDFVVVSDCTHNDTTAFADVLLPAATWGEKSGTVTNSERRISRQRAFLDVPGQARADWWIICQFAQAMGYAGFDYASEHEIFCEYARLTGAANDGSRDLDLSALSDIGAADYAALQPRQWPLRKDGDDTERLFADGAFYTANRKARFIAIDPRAPARAADGDFPLLLNTGRVRDQWHSMTRTAKSPRLMGHVNEPFAELHPRDAERYQVEDGALIELASAQGKAIVRARIRDTQEPGAIFVPMHWNDQFAPSAGINRLTQAALDPISGQPEFKHTPVRIAPYRPAWQGFLLSRREVQLQGVSYWSRAHHQAMWQYELAGEQSMEDWASYARSLLCRSEDAGDWSEMFDSGAARYRGARFVGQQLDACIFIGPDHQLPPRDWLGRLFAQSELDARSRARVLAGTPAADQEDAGPIVCACFGVGRHTLIKAIQEQGADSPEALGALLQAGTNCGSCVPELRALIEEVLPSTAA